MKIPSKLPSREEGGLSMENTHGAAKSSRFLGALGHGVLHKTMHPPPAFVLQWELPRLP